MTNEIITNEDVQTRLVGDTDIDPPFIFCEKHNNELHGEIAHLGFSGRLSPRFTVERAHLHASHTLFTLASKTVGTEALLKHKCPICAFKEFDFVKAIAEIFRSET